MSRAAMTKFQGTKTLAQIRAQCRAQGLKFDDRLHREDQSDYVVVQGGGAKVLFNTFNGRFFGTTPDGVKFNSDLTTHENKPWFQGLLRFFYVVKGGAT
ncbi:MAG: hypothetical protein ACK4F4_07260 [Hylemonella sp.]|uniref:hypothetical protein n=1 Tax=Hylemonella sp. TaxID=2066020 RepID=UPI00391DFA71